LAKQFSTIFAMQQFHEPTKNAIITKEVYKAYKSQNEQFLHGLKNEIRKLKRHKSNRIYLQNKTKRSLAKIIAKQDEFAKKKKAKKKFTF